MQKWQLYIEKAEIYKQNDKFVILSVFDVLRRHNSSDFKYVFRIVGWDFKHYPRLSESIHIGDEVTKINDIRVTSAHMARKTLKGCNTEQVDLVIKRLPYAQVMAICRHHNGEKLGIQRLGGTAEVKINKNVLLREYSLLILLSDKAQRANKN